LNSFVSGFNYTLHSLVSKKGLEIKVKNPKEYFFEPKEITEKLIICYALVGDNEKFIDEVVLDKRSYKEENFVIINKLIDKGKLHLPVDTVKKFREFAQRCQDKFEENTLRESFLDEAPEEYIDQLFMILMENPVKLPSGNVVDLQQLKKHLVNDPTDPYTRQPLKLEDVEEMPELKIKVEEFKKEKLEEFRKEMEKRRLKVQEAAEEEDDEMD
jgi:ubiquitin conjugation factor E4 B